MDIKFIWLRNKSTILHISPSWIQLQFPYFKWIKRFIYVCKIIVFFLGSVRTKILSLDSIVNSIIINKMIIWIIYHLLKLKINYKYVSLLWNSNSTSAHLSWFNNLIGVISTHLPNPTRNSPHPVLLTKGFKKNQSRNQQ